MGDKQLKLKDNEEILFSAVTVLKKQNGTLNLSNMRLIWEPSSSGISILYLPLDNIKKFMVSPASSPAVLVKIQLGEDPKAPSFVFQFTSDSAKEDQSACRELLSQILPKFLQPQDNKEDKKVDPEGDDFQKPKAKKKKAEGESDAAPPKKKVKTEHVPIIDLTAEKVKQESKSEERKQKLKADPVLREIYNEIVGNGILSEEEFWQSRAEIDKEANNTNVVQSTDKMSQQVGISSSFLSASSGNKQSILMSILQPTKQTKDNVHFKLTPPIIQQIFVEFPEVRVAYKRNVPDKLTEAEFWTKFLQSHYIKKKDDKNSKADKEVKEEVQIKKEKGIFDDVPAEDKEEMNKRLKEIDPTLNITFEDDENDEKNIGLLRDRRGKKVRVKDTLANQIIAKVNRHGAYVLESFENSATDAIADTAEARMSEAIEKSSGVAKPTSQNTNDKTDGATDASQSNPNYRKFMQEKVTWHELEDEPSEVVVPQLSLPFTSPQQYFGLAPKTSKAKDKASSDFLKVFKKDLAKLNTGSVKIDSVDDLAQEINNELFIGTGHTSAFQLNEAIKSAFSTSSEVLRHFWASQQSQSYEAKEKTKRLVTSMMNLMDKVEKLRATCKDNESKAVLRSVWQPLNTAVTFYKQKR